RPRRADPAYRARPRPAGAGRRRRSGAGARGAGARPDRKVPARPDPPVERAERAARPAAADPRPAAARPCRRQRARPPAPRQRRTADRRPMRASMQARLERLEHRLAEVDRLLASEEAVRDLAVYRRLNREHAELAELVEHFVAWKQAARDHETAVQMRGDPEMREFADEEAAAAAARLADEEAVLQRLLLPKDPDDERSVILEIRAGTGGDESALFAGDLLRMYLRYAERQRWQTEILSERASELGGYKEVIVRIDGDAVYSRLKFESGGHRVQRVPETEAQG